MRYRSRLVRRIAMAGALVAITGCTQQSRVTPPAAAVAEILVTERFGPAREPARALFILVSDRPDADARAGERALAQALVARVPGSRAVLVLRPGHRASVERASPGDAGRGNGDDLTADRLATLASAIEAVEQGNPGARRVLIGSGGGAAAIANLAGTHPRLVGAMVLVACPCALPEWRAIRAKADPAGGWREPVSSLDPLQTAGGIAPDLRSVLIVGETDNETPPSLMRAYAEGLALRGIETDFRILPDRGHDVLGDPAVIEAAVALATGSEVPQ